MESNSMFIKDENGNEKEMEILFTFDHQERKYVIFRDVANTDEEVFASAYTDDGELLPIETDAEWEMVEEVLLSFTEESDG